MQGKKHTKGLLKFKIENVFFLLCFLITRILFVLPRKFISNLYSGWIQNKEKIKHSILQLVMVTDRNGKKRAGNFFFCCWKISIEINNVMTFETRKKNIHQQWKESIWVFLFLFNLKMKKKNITSINVIMVMDFFAFPRADKSV